MSYNVYDIKVAALISDDIVKEVQRISGGKNITESLLIALKYYIDNQKLYKAWMTLIRNLSNSMRILLPMVFEKSIEADDLSRYFGMDFVFEKRRS